jgi:hypothetical protein
MSKSRISSSGGLFSIPIEFFYVDIILLYLRKKNKR